jgi:quercetin dioxygenase-like cupin family protein
MRNWDISTIDVEPHHPQVLDSDEEGRAIVLQLPAGEALQEHQVHEHAWLYVVSGSIEITEPDGETVSGGAGLLAAFDPNERREVRATEDARLLLVLSPWPGEGHPSRRDYPPGD